MIKLCFKTVPAALVAAIAIGFRQNSLQANPEYVTFMAAAAHTGRLILMGAIVAFVTDLAAMIVFTIRNGQADTPSGTVISGPLPMSLNRPMMGRSKRKILGSRSQFMLMESLASGRATLGERMMVLGICAALASFLLIFVGAGLMLMQQLIILALIPTVPGCLFWKGARSAWTEYREAKDKLEARHAVHDPSGSSS